MKLLIDAICISFLLYIYYLVFWYYRKSKSIDKELKAMEHVRDVLPHTNE